MKEVEGTSRDVKRLAPFAKPAIRGRYIELLFRGL